MNKQKFYLLLIIALLLSNIFLVWNFFKHPAPRKEPKFAIIKKLNFDENQIAQYEVIIKEHQQNARQNNDSILALKNNLYAHLTEPTDSVLVDSLIKNISLLQQKAEYINYYHFLEIKKICKPEQQENFKQLTTELATLFNHNRRPLHKP